MSELRLPSDQFRPSSQRVITGRSGREVLICRTGNGDLRAVDNRCYHMGLPLAGGDIEDLVSSGGGYAIRCPHHGRLISLEDGAELSDVSGFEPANARRFAPTQTHAQRVLPAAVAGDELLLRVEPHDMSFRSDRYNAVTTAPNTPSTPPIVDRGCAHMSSTTGYHRRSLPSRNSAARNAVRRKALFAAEAGVAHEAESGDAMELGDSSQEADTTIRTSTAHADAGGVHPSSSSPPPPLFSPTQPRHAMPPWSPAPSVSAQPLAIPNTPPLQAAPWLPAAAPSPPSIIGTNAPSLDEPSSWPNPSALT